MSSYGFSSVNSKRSLSLLFPRRFLIIYKTQIFLYNYICINLIKYYILIQELFLFKMRTYCSYSHDYLISIN